MPLRIAIAGVIALAACVVVPVSVSAVSAGNDGTSANAEDAEPPEPDPSIAPAAAIATDGLSGASLNAGYGSVRSWPVLLMLIAAGFVPAVFMIARSAIRRRDGPLPNQP